MTLNATQDSKCHPMAAVVAQRQSNQEVAGSNPTGCWAFLFFFLFLHQWSVLNQVTQLISDCVLWRTMPSCAAWGETGTISSDWLKSVILVRAF